VPDFDSDSPWPTRASWPSRTGALTGTRPQQRPHRHVGRRGPQEL